MCLSQRFGQNNTGGNRHIERPRLGNEGNAQPGGGGGMDKIWRTEAFLSNQQNVVCCKAGLMVHCLAARRQKQESSRLGEAKRMPIIMAGQVRDITIIQTGATQLPVIKCKAARLDDIDRYSQTGGKAQHGADVSGLIGLK